MRLVTRSDFDGLICGVILNAEGLIDSYKFVHPKDVQEGLIEIFDNDILTNIPYWPGCGMWFDHHSSEDDSKLLLSSDFKGESRHEKSCARIVYEYFGGEKKYPQFREMIEAVDRSDSGQLTLEDIKNPQGWIMLSFVMDPRTGLGRYKDYCISNYQLMENLIEYCGKMPIEEILQLPDVVERIVRYKNHEKRYKKQIRNHAKIHQNCLVLDFRNLRIHYAGNRFIEYTMYPQQNISVRMMRGKNTATTVFAIGHSILNRTCKTNVGALCSRYRGGGHDMVGTCQVSREEADDILNEIIIEIINKG